MPAITEFAVNTQRDNKEKDMDYSHTLSSSAAKVLPVNHVLQRSHSDYR